MTTESDLKIFISWSGDLAKQITKVLREWLPQMFDHIDPWASEVDIDAGTRGLDAIQERLSASAFGIIVVTTENMSKPWLNFEAGALSKALVHDTTRVVPLLVNFEDIYQLQGPIAQFQAIKMDREGMARLCRSIAAVGGLDSVAVSRRFEWAWPSLETATGKAKEGSGEQPPPPVVDEKDLLADLVKHVRLLDRKLDAAVDGARSGSIPVTPRAGRFRSEGESRIWTTARHRDWTPIETSIWNDEARLQNVMAEVRSIAAEFKPVRQVEVIERDGTRYIGVRFADDQGLGSGDFNWFMERILKFQVPISIETGPEDLRPV